MSTKDTKDRPYDVSQCDITVSIFDHFKSSDVTELSLTIGCRRRHQAALVNNIRNTKENKVERQTLILLATCNLPLVVIVTVSTSPEQ